jgi:3-dehydroquinate synthase
VKEMWLECRSGKSRIVVGESLENLGNYCESPVIVTDSNVRKHHGKRLDGEIIEISPGEKNKTLETVEMIYSRLLELELQRSSCLVGVGGGIVCDIAGFVASTYLRGVRCGFAPTTLLAQVDAGIGGKNGVNYKGYKNIIGNIRQPEFCLCDFSTLKTLPKNEMRCGFAEIVKSAAIGDAGLFSYLEENWEKAFGMNQAALEKVVTDSAAVKMGIVRADEEEKGLRRKLNFGHTIGHAIEKADGMPHGEAVSIGMVAAARLSMKRNLIGKDEVERLENILSDIGLPTRTSLEKEKIMDGIRKDKKRDGETIMMSLLAGLGKARIEEVPLSEVEVVVDDMR